MKRKDWMLTGLILFPLTLLMIYDFFPEMTSFLHVPKPIIIGLLLVILFLGFHLTRYRHDQSTKSDWVWQVVLMSYLFALLVVFTLLGGDSQVGISLSNPAIWLVLAISVFETIQQYRKLKAAQLTT